MAKKKKKDIIESKVSLSAPNSHPIQTVYMLLAMVGVVKERGDLKIGYEQYGGRVSIAVPNIKYAIALDNDDFMPFKENGWHIENVVYGDIEPFSRVFFSVDAARVADLYARVDPNVKSTSKPEEKLYSEIQRRMLPIPNRNHKFFRDNGTELTTPDFTWEDEKIAFFMDGAYWHSVKQDQDIMNAIKKSKKVRDDIVSARKDKVRNDGQIRSELGMRGWIVLSCTDEDIEDTAGVHRVVDMIEKALKQSQASKNIEFTSDEEANNLMDSLLHSNDNDNDNEESSEVITAEEFNNETHNKNIGISYENDDVPHDDNREDDNKKDADTDKLIDDLLS